jgi:gluconate 2-dehydrogenase gamma chain
MSWQNKFDVQRPDLQSESFYEGIADIDGRERLDQRQPEPIAQSVKANLVRRRLLLGGAVVGRGGAATEAMHDGELGAPPQTFRGVVPWQEGTADAPPGVSGSEYVFFTPAEGEFIEAAVGRLIPNDPVGPGAVEANLPFFLDRQLADKFGRGDHYYLGGSWPKGTPEQGYQARFSPAQLYRAAIAAIDKYVGAHFNGVSFSKLTTADQDKTLQGLESGEIKPDDGVNSKAFYAMLLQNTKEGYLSDPIYSGNRDMGAWNKFGFPGRAVADSASAKVDDADTSGSSRNDQNPLWLIAGAMALFFAVAAAFLVS